MKTLGVLLAMVLSLSATTSSAICLKAYNEALLRGSSKGNVMIAQQNYTPTLNMGNSSTSTGVIRRK